MSQENVEAVRRMFAAYSRADVEGVVATGAAWLDPVVGILIAVVAAQEGRESWRGDACCHAG
jgi:hypothetical protein